MALVIGWAVLLDCQAAPPKPQDPQIQEYLKRLSQGDLKSKLAACRALGGFKDAATQGKIQQELSKLAQADPKLDIYDVFSVYVQALWNPDGYTSSLGSYIGTGDVAVMEAAVSVVCDLPSYKPGGYFYSGALGALNQEALDLALRTALLKVAFRGGVLTEIVPLLAATNKALRAQIVDYLEKNMNDPLLVRPLIDFSKRADVKKLDDGKDPSQLLTARIDKWLDKLTGGDGGAKSAEDWLKVKFASVVDQMTDKAIQKGVAALKKEQKEDGTWVYPTPSYTLGSTALSVYTLLKCDVKPDDRNLAKGLDVLLAQEPANTYTVALMACAFATAIEKIKESKKGTNLLPKLQPRLQQMVDIIVASQKPCGAWHYDIAAKTGTGVQQPGVKVQDTFDLSNTQFAVLGLRAAANNGAHVPRSTWERALAHYEREHKKKDGGWAYTGDTPGAQFAQSSTPTMTAASCYGWMICKTSLNERLSLEEVKAGEPFKMGGEFLAKRFSPTTGGDPFYFLYSLERMCMAAKMDRIGEHDWYGEGAAWLLGHQTPEGTWQGTYGESANTCLALLFLKRAFIRTPYIETGGAKPPDKPK